MARVPYVEEADLAEADRELLKRPIHVAKALANSPGLARGMRSLSGYLRSKSRLDPRLREIAIIAVGWAARSPYEWSHHVKIGLDAGVTEADVRAVMGQEAPADELTAAVIAAARETYAGPGVGDGAFARLEAAFEREPLVDLIFNMAFYCGVVRLLGSLKIDVEPEYQPYLDRFPLPPA